MNNLKTTFISNGYFGILILKKIIKNINIINIITSDKKYYTLLKKYNKNINIINNINEIHNIIKNNIPEIMFITNFKFIIPKIIYNIPKYGCYNIHASLLPKFRGPSPIQTTIIKNKKTIGITIIKINEIYDTGNIIAKKRYIIKKYDNYVLLQKKLSYISFILLIKNINNIKHNKIKYKIQNHKLATYTKKIKKIDGLINWNFDTAQYINNKIKAFYPWPTIYTKINNIKIKILKIQIILSKNTKNYKNGEIYKISKKYLYIKSIKNNIKIKQIQFENKKILNIKEAINGYKKIFYKNNIFHI